MAKKPVDEDKVKQNLRAVKDIATHHGWRIVKHDEVTHMISFKHPVHVDWGRVNVYYSRMTVGTALFHPKKGRTQLFRKYVDGFMLSRIFLNPRVHTGHGYYTKH